MTTILALDASTDACSVALARDGEIDAIFELVPREHNHRLFSMLRTLLPGGAQAAALDMLAYCAGPGSFTGLRVASSAVQGLAYTLNLPVAGVSTLACLAQGALRRGVVSATDTAFVLLDARINEIYCGLYRFEQGLPVACREDQVLAPASLPADYLQGQQRVVAMGSGLPYLTQLPGPVQAEVADVLEDCWPHSEDLIPLAQRAAALGLLSGASSVHPVYLRNEVQWKKLSEQGPRGG
ncbi:MAG: tRNA (adenosine(37)-N6)-threonylcarbamoyltransferase complex dimerization subunit type 1 TsaB [Halieaceae bacterium]|jgi:tRNA threonylcarbamoyladenosine biosynthesis protein TsaB|nr:tRNA (adenosine(37)-N6)-threonylcarbamoyltransferase complex dimerization subunit type 1 TsaB [Halieaceae bacterium]